MAEDKNYYFNLAKHYIDLNDYDKVIEALEKAQKLDPYDSAIQGFINEAKFARSQLRRR